MNQNTTIAEAKQYLVANMRKGTTCPCCNQMVKLWPRPLHSSMAYALFIIYKYFQKNPDAEWLHIEDYLKTESKFSAARGDVAKLVHWGLLEAKVGTRADGSDRNGYYKITQAGIDFVEGKTEVPDEVKIYNKKVREVSDNLISFRDALSKKFNYDEILRSYD